MVHKIGNRVPNFYYLFIIKLVIFETLEGSKGRKGGQEGRAGDGRIRYDTDGRKEGPDPWLGNQESDGMGYTLIKHGKREFLGVFGIYLGSSERAPRIATA